VRDFGDEDDLVLRLCMMLHGHGYSGDVEVMFAFVVWQDGLMCWCSG
jgi:hypothetical protein